MDIDEIVEEIADKLGIYGCGEDKNHDSDCKCRICFVCDMTTKIREAAEKEVKDKIARYLKNKYGDVGTNASRTAIYRIAKDLSLELVLGDMQ